MKQSSGPRQQYSFESVCTCIDDFQHLNIKGAFDGLEGVEKQWQLRYFCTPLLLAVKHPSEHLRQLDTFFSGLLPHTLKHRPLLSPNIITGDQNLALKAKDLLSRFPEVPQKLFTLPFTKSGLLAKPGTIWDGFKDGRWAEKYLVPEARSKFRIPRHDNPESLMQLITDMQNVAWDNLFVTSFIDTNNCVLLLKVADLGHQPDLDFARSFGRYINVLGELIDEYNSLADAARLGFKAPFEDQTPSIQALKAALFPHDTDNHGLNLSVLKAFLWAAWQRSIMLYFYYVIGVQLWHGSSSTWSSLLAVRGLRRLDDLDAEDYRGDSTQYLCNWAFELLRTTRTSLALDFRRMIKLFDNHFQGLEGRCIKDSELACKGNLPESCQRFTGAEAKSQSLHATTCDGNCNRIRWCESSYRQCESPRAVKINGDDENLKYCRASSNTMAISHVWSHGQGGRPEDGINLCLHRRYCDLARSFDCESYWIDSSCIPSDKELRKEAIMTINDIFRDSKVTLISDMDLQSKKVSMKSTEDLETLLSILLVCDWGVRAWTMLEAVRGNENKSIYILCAGDQTIRLVDLLRTIHDAGAVDLAVLLGSAQHLLPSSAYSDSAKTVEEAAHLLSQRHASKKNDELTIWGLLGNLKAPASALHLWTSNEQVNTAFLISSAPRVEEVSGYGWAPATPYIRPQRRQVPLSDGGEMQVYNVRYPSYDGRGSYIARITTQGLSGMWLVHDLDREYISELCDTCVEEMMPTPWTEDTPLVDADTDDSKIFERPDYANACFTLKALSSMPDTKVRIVRPLTTDGTAPYEGNVARGEDFTILVAICFCAGDVSNRSEWQWKGVYEWIDDTSPDWTARGMLIV